jgi:hypothetical protein
MPPPPPPSNQYPPPRYCSYPFPLFPFILFSPYPSTLHMSCIYFSIFWSPFSLISLHFSRIPSLYHAFVFFSYLWPLCCEHVPISSSSVFPPALLFIPSSILITPLLPSLFASSSSLLSPNIYSFPPSRIAFFPQFSSPQCFIIPPVFSSITQSTFLFFVSFSLFAFAFSTLLFSLQYLRTPLFPAHLPFVFYSSLYLIYL